MTNVLTTKEVSKGGISVLDAMGIALVKSTEERLLARIPFVGNGNYISGAVKLASGITLNKMVKGKIGDIVGTAFIVDGGEDLVTALINTFFGAKTEQSASAGQNDLFVQMSQI